VVGIGVNLNNTMLDGPAELRTIATSVLDLTDARHDPTSLLIVFLERLAALLDQVPVAPDLIGRLADELCLQRGQSLGVESGGSVVRGVCAGIASDGALLIDTPSGRERIVTGVMIRESRLPA